MSPRHLLSLPHSPAFLFEDLHDVRIGRSLYCKVVLVAWAPAEGFVQAPDGVPNGLFMVEMERCRKLLRQFQDLRIVVRKVCDLRHGRAPLDLDRPPFVCTRSTAAEPKKCITCCVCSDSQPKQQIDQLNPHSQWENQKFGVPLAPSVANPPNRQDKMKRAIKNRDFARTGMSWIVITVCMGMLILLPHKQSPTGF